MAAADWTDPGFFRGMRPPTTAFFWSLFSDGKNHLAILLFQTTLAGLAWFSFARSAAARIRHPGAALSLTAAILAYSLLPGIRESHHHLLSESLSLSLGLFTAAVLFHRWPRNRAYFLAALIPAATAFAFARDSNAFLLLTWVPWLLALGFFRHYPQSCPRGLRSSPIDFCLEPIPSTSKNSSTIPNPYAAASLFLFLFLASQLSSRHITVPTTGDGAGLDLNHPIVRYELETQQGSRSLFPLLNVFGMRILPYDFRRNFFSERGLQLTPPVLSKAFHWASQGPNGSDWEWYRNPNLESARLWVDQRGKSVYALFLLRHPRFTFFRPWAELAPIYLSPSILPSPLRSGFLPALILLGFLPFLLPSRKGKRKKSSVFLPPPDTGNSVGPPNSGFMSFPISAVLAVIYTALAGIGFALFLYHADAMDVERHASAHVLTLHLCFMWGVAKIWDRYLTL
jgi:hypothetical protein